MHPIWSVDRQDWVPLGELEESERLQAADGIAVVASLGSKSVALPVYNVEVHGEHVYEVGELGLLAHNACSPLRQTMIANFGHPGPGWQAAHIIPKSGFSWAPAALTQIRQNVMKAGLIDDIANGFWSLPGHAGTHTAAYIDDVVQIMSNRTSATQIKEGINLLWDLIKANTY